MKKKDFIYYASAALLLAVSVQPAYADEQESAVQPIQVKAEQAQDTVAKTASDDSEIVESKGETSTDRQEEQEKSQAEQKTENSQSVPASLPKQSETKVENSQKALRKLSKEKKLARLTRGHRKKELLGTQPSIALDMLGQLVVQVMWLFNPKHLSMSAVITEA